jgi:hypothetical protein
LQTVPVGQVSLGCLENFEGPVAHLLGTPLMVSTTATFRD